MINYEKILCSLLVLYPALTCVVCQECSAERQSRCRFVVLEELERRSTGLSSKELEIHCKTLRQNVDCLVWQVSQCSVVEGRERTSDAIYRGWKYLQSICDTFGGWWQNRCFQREDSKQCEKYFSGGGSTALKSSCIEYERFRECISDLVKRRCEPEDSNILGSFLLDKAGEMVWRCPGQSYSSSSQNLYGSGSAYSSPLIADAPYGAVNVKYSDQGCNARATEEMRGCLDRYQYERDQSYGTREGEERFRRSCCASWNYRRCVENAIRTHCYDSREVEYGGGSNIVEHGRDLVCREHWRYTCSGAVRISITSAMVAITLLLFTLFANKLILD